MIHAYAVTSMGVVISIFCVINMTDGIVGIRTDKGYIPYDTPLQRYILVIE